MIAIDAGPCLSCLLSCKGSTDGLPWHGRPPLQDAVDELAAASAADGSLGNGTDRYLASAKDPGPPPEGAGWRTIRVKFPKSAFLPTIKYLS